jgi:hypothetical protein
MEAGFGLTERFAALALPGYRITEYGKAWFEDEGFLRDFDRLEPETRRTADRKYFLRSLLSLAKGLPGDTAECGVWTGSSSWFICRALEGSGTTHHGFDSFEGLSSPEPEDGPYWHAGDLRTVEDTARSRLEGFDAILYPGWIPDRFDEVADRAFCFVHLDVDLYRPTLDSLEFFYERTLAGGILLFDDHGFITCPGATRAIDGFFEDKPEPVIAVPTGQAFVIKR